MIYTTFDKLTGRLKGRTVTPNDTLPTGDEIYIEGFFEPNRHYVDPKTLVIQDAGEAQEFYIQDGINGWLFDSVGADLSFKARRNLLLRESDWVELPSAQLRPNINTWLKYRQELRDVPQQPGYPEQITWPVKPKE